MFIKRAELFLSYRKSVYISRKLRNLNASCSSFWSAFRSNFSSKVCWEFGSFHISLFHIHISRLLNNKFIVLHAVTVAPIGHLEAASMGKQVFAMNDCSYMHKLQNTLCVINLNTAIGKVRKQAAEYCSSPGYSLDSLKALSRSYWEPLGFHAFLDTSKLLFTVTSAAALSLLEAISIILVPATYNLISRVVCLHLKEQRGLQWSGWIKNLKINPFCMWKNEWRSSLALPFTNVRCWNAVFVSLRFSAKPSICHLYRSLK